MESPVDVSASAPSLSLALSAPLAVRKKRNHLPLKTKVEVIKTLQKSPGIKLRTLAEMFQCGKTQIAQILKTKESLLSEYAVAGGRSPNQVSRVSGYVDVNNALLEWYTLACSKKLRPRGTQLTDKAKQIAACLGKRDFKGSNGWLDKWKKRYDIKLSAASEESSETQVTTADSWKEGLPGMLQGYENEDIWSMDTTGLFWQALPDRGFREKAKKCKGGRDSKHRITVAFFVTGGGEKEKPVIVCTEWKNPASAHLPVDYFTQKVAWMTAELMKSILTKLNQRLLSSKRSIVLLMDNANCHLETRFSNVKVCFLPSCTTSQLHPLRNGIVRNFRMYYRRLFLRYVLSKIEESGMAADAVGSMKILTAVRWVVTAWSMIDSETVSRCFRMAGVLTGEVADGDSPLLDRDVRLELQSLIGQTMVGHEHCALDEYLTGEDDLQVCMNVDSENWEEEFLAQLGQGDKVEATVEGDQLEELPEDNGQDKPTLKVKSFKEAIQSLEDVQEFLMSQGHVPVAMNIGSLIDTVACCNTRPPLPINEA